MPTLDVISVNIWSILISLCNLLILFFIIKKFLYKPVRKMLAERQAQWTRFTARPMTLCAPQSRIA